MKSKHRPLPIVPALRHPFFAVRHRNPNESPKSRRNTRAGGSILLRSISAEHRPIWTRSLTGIKLISGQHSGLQSGEFDAFHSQSISRIKSSYYDYVAQCPPSTRRSAPVMKLLASLSRKVAGPLNSSGVANLSRRLPRSHSSSRSGRSASRASVMAVRM